MFGGLYTVRFQLNDTVDRSVMWVHADKLPGRNWAFDHIGIYSDLCSKGTYTSGNGRGKGQVLNQEHTVWPGENSILDSYEACIGFSGTCDGKGALVEATALAGKRSLRMTAVLKLMRRA